MEKNIINILKISQKIQLEENDNIIKILKQIKFNSKTGFEMFGDEYYDKFSNFDEEIIKHVKNETEDNIIIINTDDEKSIHKLVEISNDIYELKEYIKYVNEEDPYLVIDVAKKESYGSYNNIFHAISCINVDFSYIDNEKIIEIWNDYDFFDLADFMYNYYPSDEILDGKYGKEIVELLKHYGSICLQDDHIKEKIQKNEK